MKKAKRYLGDGVYIEGFNDEIVLTTEDGIHQTNCIVLEPEVIQALLKYLERVPR